MQVDVVDTTQGLDELREEWEALEGRDPHAPYYVTHRFVRAWWTGFSADDAYSLHLVCVRQNGALVGIAPLTVRRQLRKNQPFNTLRFASHGDYLRFLLDPEQNSDKICRTIFEHLDADQAWNRVSLGNIPGRSPLAGYLLRSGHNSDLAFHVENPHVDLRGYDRFEDFTAQHLPAHTRKYRNKFLREQDVRFRVFRGDEDGIFDRLAALHRLEKRFLVEQKSREERYSLYEQPARAEHIRQIFTGTNDAVTFGYVTTSGELLGYRTCFLHRGRLLSWNSAYHPNYDAYRIGKIIQFDILQHVFETGMADVFDFGAGRYPWKFEWTDDFSTTYRLQYDLKPAQPAPRPAQAEAAPRTAPLAHEQEPPATTPEAGVLGRARRRLGQARRGLRGAASRVREKGQRPVIWYVPHPDDETIFMGGSISLHRHRRNILVVLTRGGASGAIKIVNRKLAKPLTRAKFMEARLRELAAAASTLGVHHSDVITHDLPDGGLEVSDVHEIVKDMARRFPRASHRTMSYLDPHGDHATAGEALRKAHESGVVKDCLFHLPIPLVDEDLGAEVELSHDAVVAAKRAALREYEVWRPQIGRYAIGAHSVAKLIRHQTRTPTERVHGPDYRALDT